jgi:hypothetical protein
MTEPDLIQQGIRQAMYREIAQNLRWFTSIVELSCVSTPILLALILFARHRLCDDCRLPPREPRREASPTA